MTGQGRECALEVSTLHLVAEGTFGQGRIDEGLELEIRGNAREIRRPIEVQVEQAADPVQLHYQEPAALIVGNGDPATTDLTADVVIQLKLVHPRIEGEIPLERGVSEPDGPVHGHSGVDPRFEALVGTGLAGGVDLEGHLGIAGEAEPVEAQLLWRQIEGEGFRDVVSGQRQGGCEG